MFIFTKLSTNFINYDKIRQFIENLYKSLLIDFYQFCNSYLRIKRKLFLRYVNKKFG